jgi:hypothetical protein
MCRSSRCSWLWAYFLMTLSTVSISRSLWRLSFLMYQGASTISRINLFWNLCMIFLLLWLVQPKVEYYKSILARESVGTAWACYIQIGLAKTFFCISVRVLPFFLHMRCPPEFGIQRHAQVFGCALLWNNVVVDIDLLICWEYKRIQVDLVHTPTTRDNGDKVI